MPVQSNFASTMRRMAADSPRMVEQELKNAMALAETEIKRRTPVGQRYDESGRPTGPSGDLRASIHASPVKRTKNTLTGTVSSPLDYARYVEYGTRAHIIDPLKPGGHLRFWSEGEIRFARRVKHPGMRGHFMFKMGTEAASKRFETSGAARLRAWVLKYG